LVTTYVIGFALSDDNGNAVSCEGVDPSGTTCASMAANDPKKPCCTLHEIAYNGGSDRAFFASDAETLRAKLKEAMDQVTGKTTSSRTVAAFGSTSSGGQYEFLSGFRVNPFAAWSGKLERVRWECTAGAGGSKAQPQPIDASKGDDYAVALNKQTTRKFWTALPTTSASGTTRAGDTLRPGLSADDGLGTVGADVVTGSGTSFVGAISAAQMGLTASSCPDTSSAEECKQKYLNYALALAQPKPTWSSRQGNALGDIYHANPVQVGPPDEFLRDDSYLQFRLDAGARTPFVLAATNDGLLHAFKADVKSDTEDAELWAFLPPAVLPNVGKQYGSRALLLDASPVVKNVAFGAQTGGGRARNDVARWATIAVSGLTVGTGATGGRGYFALDVTDPKNPKFLWQLTKDAAGRDLFGTAPGQPAIATLYFREGSDGKLAEVPVAILPGGEGRAHKTGTCNRWKSVTTASDPLVTPRSKVRCWIGAGASFTIVRLLDGKVIRTFRNDPAGNGTADHPADATAPILPDAIVKGSGFGDGFAGIDSPITGAVALYPAATGTVTTRAFVGDYDGTLWKADLSDPDPRAWRFEIFHDAYFPNDPANRDATKWGPIAVPPVLSVDRFGDVVVNYATGDQNNFSEVNLNHVYSVTERTETVSGAKVLAPKVNWHLKFPAGITPTGPMSLFGEALYLSTFTPGVGAASACVKGQGTIWGVHYVNASSIANDDGSRAPAPALKKEGLGDDTASATACPGPYPNTDSDAKDFFRCNVLAQGTIVFGTSVTQRPSCVDTAASPIGLDPYFGGAYSPVTNIAVGDFELVAQTGAGGAKNVVGASLNTMARKLPTPPPSTRVDSWATLVE
jgi:type IV pilus assembly protein PilY1